MTITVFIIYFIIIGLIVFKTRSRDQSLSGYILGGRSLGPWQTGLGAGASDMSGWLLLAFPGAIYSSGLSAAWIAIGLALGAFCCWAFVARRLRVYSKVANNSLTISAYLSNRFQDDKSLLQVVTAVIIIIFFTLYIASGLIASSMVMNIIFGISTSYGLVLSLVIVLFYSLFGGYIGIANVDLFQAALMFFALLIVPVVTLPAIQSNIASITDYVPHGLSLADGLTVTSFFSHVGWGLGYFGLIHYINKMIGIKHSNQIRTAGAICMTWMVCSMIGAIAVGLFGIVYFQHDIEKPSYVFLYLSKSVLNPLFYSIVLTAILSAALSTISTQLLVIGSCVSEDLYHPFKKSTSNKQLLIITKLSIIVVALVSLYFAAKPTGSLFKLVSFAWAGFGSSFSPLILASLFYRNITIKAAAAGMIVGSVVCIWWHTQGFALYEIIPGFFSSIITIFVVSKLGAPKDSVVNQHDEFLRALKNDEKDSPVAVNL